MKILLIGGYGNFGKRLAHSLLTYHDYEIVIAGRSAQKAASFANSLGAASGKSVTSLAVDVIDSDIVGILNKIRPDIVVNASGPFRAQARAYRVARACIDAGNHYIDLADDRRFVCDFAPALQASALQKGVILVTGASTVPGLSSAVLNAYGPLFSELHSVYYGISPGNRTERGVGTVASILAYTGKPFTTLIDGKMRPVYGWQNLGRYDFGDPVGPRWMGNCDIPDLELLPPAHPNLRNLRFKAGLEVSLLHLGLWLLSMFTAIGLVGNWAKYAGPLTRMSDWFKSRGSDSGGMFVEMRGRGPDNRPLKFGWQLIAQDGSGPNVPTIPAELVIEKIAAGEIEPGARPCLGLIDLETFFAIARRWGIYQREIRHD